MRPDHSAIWVHSLASRGIPPRDIAFVLSITYAMVEHDLATFKRPERLLPRPRRRKAPLGHCPILGQTGTKVRRFHELGYTAGAIASVFLLDQVTVEDFLRRITPLCRGRAVPDKLARPRSRVEDRAAFHARARAEARRLEQVIPGEWSYASRCESSHRRDWARFNDALRSGRLAAPELLELAARAHYVTPCPAVEPAIWAGETDPRLIGSTRLTDTQIIEASELLRSGESYPRVAQRYGVSVNTLRRYVVDVGQKRATGRHPVERVVCKHGVVRWDMPLIYGHETKVLVTCSDCGRDRYVKATLIERPDRPFTGRCEECRKEGILSAEQKQEAARMRGEGWSWCALGERFGVDRRTVKHLVDRPLAPQPFPRSAAPPALLGGSTHEKSERIEIATEMAYPS